MRTNPTPASQEETRDIITLRTKAKPQRSTGNTKKVKKKGGGPSQAKEEAGQGRGGPSQAKEEAGQGTGRPSQAKEEAGQGICDPAKPIVKDNGNMGTCTTKSPHKEEAREEGSRHSQDGRSGPATGRQQNARSNWVQWLQPANKQAGTKKQGTVEEADGGQPKKQREKKQGAVEADGGEPKKKREKKVATLEVVGDQPKEKQEKEQAQRIATAEVDGSQPKEKSEKKRDPVEANGILPKKKREKKVDTVEVDGSQPKTKEDAGDVDGGQPKKKREKKVAAAEVDGSQPKEKQEKKRDAVEADGDEPKKKREKKVATVEVDSSQLKEKSEKKLATAEVTNSQPKEKSEKKLGTAEVTDSQPKEKREKNRDAVQEADVGQPKKQQAAVEVDGGQPRETQEKKQDTVQVDGDQPEKKREKDLETAEDTKQEDKEGKKKKKKKKKNKNDPSSELPPTPGSSRQAHQTLEPQSDGSGYLLSPLPYLPGQPSADTPGPSAPLFSHKRKRELPGAVPLYNGPRGTSIVQFAKDASPSEAELTNISSALSSINIVARNIWPQARAVLFGSQATGLALPGSDLDVVILGVIHPSTNEDGSFTLPNQADAVYCLRALAKQLKSAGVVNTFHLIPGAKVPLVKITVGSPSLQVDISVGVANGASAVGLIQRAATLMPPLRPLCLVLKALLKESDLNEVFTGGLSSYTLVNMVIAHLQCESMCGGLTQVDFLHTLLQEAGGDEVDHEERLSIPKVFAFLKKLVNTTDFSGIDLGGLLTSFLTRYGRVISLQDEAVSIVHGGIRTKPSGWKKNKKARACLSVEDPQVAEHDVASASTRIYEVRSLFTECCSRLESQLWHAPSALPASPVLSSQLRHSPSAPPHGQATPGVGETPAGANIGNSRQGQTPGQQHTASGSGTASIRDMWAAVQEDGHSAGMALVQNQKARDQPTPTRTPECHPSTSSSSLRLLSHIMSVRLAVSRDPDSAKKRLKGITVGKRPKVKLAMDAGTKGPKVNVPMDAGTKCEVEVSMGAGHGRKKNKDEKKKKGKDETKKQVATFQSLKVFQMTRSKFQHEYLEASRQLASHREELLQSHRKLTVAESLPLLQWLKELQEKLKLPAQRPKGTPKATWQAVTKADSDWQMTLVNHARGMEARKHPASGASRDHQGEAATGFQHHRDLDYQHRDQGYQHHRDHDPYEFPRSYGNLTQPQHYGGGGGGGWGDDPRGPAFLPRDPPQGQANGVDHDPYQFPRSYGHSTQPQHHGGGDGGRDWGDDPRGPAFSPHHPPQGQANEADHDPYHFPHLYGNSAQPQHHGGGGGGGWGDDPRGFAFSPHHPPQGPANEVDHDPYQFPRSYGNSTQPQHYGGGGGDGGIGWGDDPRGPAFSPHHPPQGPANEVDCDPYQFPRSYGNSTQPHHHGGGGGGWGDDPRGSAFSPHHPQQGQANGVAGQGQANELGEPTRKQKREIMRNSKRKEFKRVNKVHEGSADGNENPLAGDSGAATGLRTPGSRRDGYGMGTPQGSVAGAGGPEAPVERVLSSAVLKRRKRSEKWARRLLEANGSGEGGHQPGGGGGGGGRGWGDDGRPVDGVRAGGVHKKMRAGQAQQDKKKKGRGGEEGGGKGQLHRQNLMPNEDQSLQQRERCTRALTARPVVVTGYSFLIYVAA
eukprot:gene23080-30272_t